MEKARKMQQAKNIARNIFLFCVVISAVLTANNCVFAKGEKLILKDFNPDTFKVKNPFEPQFQTIQPKVKKKVKKKPAKVTPVAVSTLETEPIKPPVLNISGLIWNSDRPQAIVNNRVVDVGDIIQDAEVTAITKDGIEIEYQDLKFNIKYQSLSF